MDIILLCSAGMFIQIRTIIHGRFSIFIFLYLLNHYCQWVLVNVKWKNTTVSLVNNIVEQCMYLVYIMKQIYIYAPTLNGNLTLILKNVSVNVRMCTSYTFLWFCYLIQWNIYTFSSYSFAGLKICFNLYVLTMFSYSIVPNYRY